MGKYLFGNRIREAVGTILNRFGYYKEVTNQAGVKSNIIENKFGSVEVKWQGVALKSFSEDFIREIASKGLADEIIKSGLIKVNYQEHMVHHDSKIVNASLMVLEEIK